MFRNRATPGLMRRTKVCAFIGRIERGFDFLGYHFSPAGLTTAQNASRLVEAQSAAIHFTLFSLGFNLCRINILAALPAATA